MAPNHYTALTSGTLAGGGEAAELPVLHDGAAHPVDLGVARDGLVVRVDHDHLEVLVSGVLKNEAGWIDMGLFGKKKNFS